MGIAFAQFLGHVGFVRSSNQQPVCVPDGLCKPAGWCGTQRHTKLTRGEPREEDGGRPRFKRSEK